MAKKKTESSIDIENKLREDFGDSIFVSGDNVLTKERKIVSISPKIDTITYGGCQEGSTIFLTGREKVGKSAMALNICKNFQKLPRSDGGPRKVFWCDAEAKLEKKDLKYVEGLKTDEEYFTHIASSEDKLLTGEDFFNIAEALIRGKKECVVVIDSLSVLCSTEEFDSDYSKRFMANMPSLTSRFLRKVIQSLVINNNVLICLSHVIANLSPYGASTSESGGAKIRFAANLHLQAKKREFLTSGEKVTGMRTLWECKATSLGPPHREDWAYIKFGTGICPFTELAEFAIDFGYVRKNGAWLKVDFGDGEENVQGLDGVANLLKENPKYVDIIQSQVKELYNI